jgi:thiol-disulfide isomerase/thioredoxin
MTLSRRALTVGLSGLGLLGAAPALGATPQVGVPAPDFELLTFDGERISSRDLAGQVVVLNFWATWCGPCKVELPLLESVYRRARGAGLRIFAVATEDSLSPEQLKPLSKALTLPLILKLQGPYRALDAVPTNYVIDRQGVLRYAQAGAFDLDAINRILGPLLGARPPREASPNIVQSMML